MQVGSTSHRKLSFPFLVKLQLPSGHDRLWAYENLFSIYKSHIIEGDTGLVPYINECI